MNIFNSLGSNYDWKFVLQTLFSSNRNEKLTEYLEKKYNGQVILLYKGREAIELALKQIDLPKNTTVAINGFTCYAVYKAITNAGYNVEYIDTEKNNLNFSLEKLEKHLKKNSSIKIVMIQNTLGYPCDIEKIAQICKKNNLILIEDLAHSPGLHYKNTQAGTVGDFIILSFSQDKMIDSVSGGALVIRNKDYQKEYTESLYSVPLQQQIIDRFYPLFTWKIRKGYSVGLGKIVHAILKSLHLLSQPMSESTKLHTLPNWYANLAYTQFKTLEENLIYRQKIASIYSKILNKKCLLFTVSRLPVLRFPILVNNREELIKHLKHHGVYVSDIWYDAPVAPKKYLNKANYNHECPNAEEISEKILNLPTHKNVSEQDALQIAEKINEWLKSQ